MAKVVADYKCTLVQGVLSHELTKFGIDNKKVLPSDSALLRDVDVDVVPCDVLCRLS